jgi:hypothetical protein
MRDSYTLDADSLDASAREAKAFLFLSPEALSRQQLSVVSPRWFAHSKGVTLLSGLLPTGEGVTYVTRAGEVGVVHLATARYNLRTARRVRRNEPCNFDCSPPPPRAETFPGMD